MTHRRIRVMQVCDHLGWRKSKVHGVVRLFQFMLDRFNQDRFDISYCALRERTEAAVRLEEQGASISYLNRGRFDPRTYFDLHRLFRQKRIDVVHLHGNGASTFGRLAAWRLGIPNLVQEYSVMPDLPAYAIWVDRLLAPLSDKILTIGKAVRDWAIVDKKIDPWRLEVVYFGIPLEEYQPPPPEIVENEKKRLGIPLNKPVVGTVSRLYPQKGLAYLLEAATQIIDKVPEATIVIIGDGPLEQELKERASQLGIAERVIFAGFHPDMPLAMSLFDVKVFPTLWEGVPFTGLEAMAMARPIVSTKVDGLLEILAEGRNALFVAPKDVDALADRITRLLLHPDEARRLGHQAQADVRRFHIGKTVQHFEELYEGAFKKSADQEGCDETLDVLPPDNFCTQDSTRS